MYVIKEDGCGFISPWDIPIENRIKKIFNNTSTDKKNVVFLYERADTSTFRYRVYNLCAALEYSSKFAGTYFFADELEIVKKYISEIDILILSRYRWSLKLENLVNYAKEKNIAIIFDVDDMVYDTKYVSTIMSTLSVIDTEDRYDYWFSYIGRLGKSLEMCDYVITTNSFLANSIYKDSRKRCFVIPNTYNYFQAKVSDNYFKQKENQKSEGKFVIGYFSGTPSHINDFLCVAPEILDFLDAYEDAVLRIVGFMDFPASMNEYIAKGKIEFYPLTDFIRLQKLIAEVDINIVPLVNNEFSSCKSELKFFEAGIVGTITCATPSYTYSKCIRNGKNGFLCNYGEWFDVFENIYKMRNSKKLKNIISKALEDSKRLYEYSNITDVMEENFERILKEKTNGI